MPETGEIVVCTVREITSHGIYVNLDQYDGTNGFLHVSEISTGWVRNIDRVAKAPQKLVLKVIRANKTRQGNRPVAEAGHQRGEAGQGHRMEEGGEGPRDNDAVKKKIGFDDAHERELRHGEARGRVRDPVCGPGDGARRRGRRRWPLRAA